MAAALEHALGPRLAPSVAGVADWRPGDQRVFVADIRKARRLLDWSPKVPTVEGVDRLLRWVRDHRHLFETPARGCPHA